MTLTPSKYIRGLTLLLSTWAEIYLSCSPVYEVLNTYVHLMTKGLDKKRFITCFTDENERERERERKYGFIFHNPKSTRVNCQFKIKDHHKKNLFYRLKCSCSFFSITDTYERKNKNYYASFQLPNPAFLDHFFSLNLNFLFSIFMRFCFIGGSLYACFNYFWLHQLDGMLIVEGKNEAFIEWVPKSPKNMAKKRIDILPFFSWFFFLFSQSNPWENFNLTFKFYNVWQDYI